MDLSKSTVPQSSPMTARTTIRTPVWRTQVMRLDLFAREDFATVHRAKSLDYPRHRGLLPAPWGDTCRSAYSGPFPLLREGILFEPECWGDPRGASQLGLSLCKVRPTLSHPVPIRPRTGRRCQTIARDVSSSRSVSSVLPLNRHDAFAS